MDRVRSTLGGAVPPVYLDLGSPSTPPSATFQTDPGLPPTSLTPEHANLITEELRNLVIALGGTPASDDDTQLATLFESGTFEPIVSASGGLGDVIAGDFAAREGRYQRIGNTVHAWFGLVFTNTTGALNAAVLNITPPFFIAEDTAISAGHLTGAVQATDTHHRQFRTDLFDTSDFRLQIRERTWAAGAASTLTIGNIQRVIIGEIVYRHNGVYRY